MTDIVLDSEDDSFTTRDPGSLDHVTTDPEQSL